MGSHIFFLPASAGKPYSFGILVYIFLSSDLTVITAWWCSSISSRHNWFPLLLVIENLSNKWSSQECSHVKLDPYSRTSTICNLCPFCFILYKFIHPDKLIAQWVECQTSAEVVGLSPVQSDNYTQTYNWNTVTGIKVSTNKAMYVIQTCRKKARRHVCSE